MVGGGYYEMTRKQFNWLKEHQPFEVCYFRIYEGKEPKNYHSLYGYNRLKVEIIGERFYFAGTYSAFNGRTFVEHYAKYNVHYKNIRLIRYRRTQRTDKPQKLP